MKFSCIMTTFNDGPIMRQSIELVLHQTHQDLELLIVDDGSGPETQAILAEITDPRVTVLPQANDGLSSARNRGLHHAKGDYICFLDADDTRAPWALAEVADCIAATGAELVLVRGVLSQDRTRLHPFHDSGAKAGYDQAAAQQDMPLAQRKVWALSCEPQSANKFIARTLIERGQLRFPNDHFFEDILFHSQTIQHARSVELLASNSFTYFQRQLRAQLTGSNAMIRFDILGTARVTLQMFAQGAGFDHAQQRGALMLNVLRLLQWCETTLPHYHRHGYRTALRYMLRQINPLFLVLHPDTPDVRGDGASLITYAQEVLK